MNYPRTNASDMRGGMRGTERKARRRSWGWLTGLKGALGSSRTSSVRRQRGSVGNFQKRTRDGTLVIPLEPKCGANSEGSSSSADRHEALIS